MMAGRLTMAVGALALGLAAAQPAKADVLNTLTNASLTSTPLTISIGSGVGSLSFTSASTGYGPGAAISTAGNAMVTGLFGSVADFGSGSAIDQTGELYSFMSSSTASVIPFSAADDFVGFSYTGTDGIHYGYAEVFGPTLVGYALETTANTTITTATITASTAQAVPEPASLALLLTGVAGMGALRRRKSGMLIAS